MSIYFSISFCFSCSLLTPFFHFSLQFRFERECDKVFVKHVLHTYIKKQAFINTDIISEKKLLPSFSFAVSNPLLPPPLPFSLWFFFSKTESELFEKKILPKGKPDKVVDKKNKATLLFIL